MISSAKYDKNLMQQLGEAALDSSGLCVFVGRRECEPEIQIFKNAPVSIALDEITIQGSLKCSSVWGVAISTSSVKPVAFRCARCLRLSMCSVHVQSRQQMNSPSLISMIIDNTFLNLNNYEGNGESVFHIGISVFSLSDHALDSSDTACTGVSYFLKIIM